jgi:hypothetical protein
LNMTVVAICDQGSREDDRKGRAPSRHLKQEDTMTAKSRTGELSTGVERFPYTRSVLRPCFRSQSTRRVELIAAGRRIKICVWVTAVGERQC